MQPAPSPNDRVRVAVLYGGRSAEHEISRISARFVARSLDPARFEVIPIGITQEGRWMLPSGGLAALEAEQIGGEAIVPEADRRLVRALSPRPTAPLADIGHIDVVFPVLHGPYGEDGTMQGLLELAGVPYVGAGVLGSSLGMDKIAQKQVLEARGIPVARFASVLRHAWRSDRERVLERIESEFAYPVFVKPSNLGSSVGITRASRREELEGALDLAGRYDTRLLVEEGLSGMREIECAVLGNHEPDVSVLGEIRPTHDFYDYEAKYLDEDGAELVIPAELPGAVTARVQELARDTFLALDCAGMARVDFFVGEEGDDIRVNEINTIPGFTQISMFPRLWAASGLPADGLVARLVELAIERHAERQALETRR
ncbi:MAG: D-alanine--D-alanine ligase family protein [Candidatus Eiseniibacteriota bacterium]|jgi:D-alanine-D-alanine ligase